MKTLLIKELRLLAPAWIGGLAVVLGTALLFQEMYHLGWSNTDLSVAAPWLFAMGIAVMVNLGISSMGREMDLGTFSQLLAQPTPRLKTWHVKTGLLFAAMLTVLACFSTLDPIFRINDREGVLYLICGFTVASYAGGLWTTLLLRNSVRAFWVTLIVPIGIVMVVNAALTSEFLTLSDENAILRSESAALIIYGGIALLYARRVFMQAQDLEPAAGSMSYSVPRRTASAIPYTGAMRRRGTLAALACKEFQLQHTNLLVAALLALAQLMLIGIQYFSHETWATSHSIAKQSLWTLSSLMVWLMVPLISGASAVAEERKLGTFETQLCLPPRRRTQFTVKIAIVTLVGVGLGSVLPWLLEVFGNALGVLPGTGAPNLEELGVWCLTSAIISLFTFYASTGSRNTLGAFGTGIAFIVAIPGLMFLAWLLGTIPAPPFGLSVQALPLWSGTLIYFIGVPTILAALIVLGYRNFIHLPGSNFWLRHLGIICLILALISVVTSLVYHRDWELVVKWEPRHGVPRFSPTNPPKLATFWAGARTFVHLPDGRIWASEETPRRAINSMRAISLLQLLPASGESPPRITRGGFIGPGPWKQLAVSQVEAAAIGVDGSLWSLGTLADRYFPSESPPNRFGVESNRKQVSAGAIHFLAIPSTSQPNRFGTGSDWKQVSAGATHFLALKNDGTLWGWGESDNGEVIPNAANYLREPIQIGHDSDWVACVAGPFISIGAKADGSTWCWGNVLMGTAAGGVAFQQRTPARLNMPFAVVDLASLSGLNYGCNFHLKNGSRGIVRFVKARSTNPGDDLRPIEAAAEYAGWFDHRNGRKPKGLDVAGYFLLSADGTLSDGSNLKVSKYSDWLAISGSEFTAALAADGTLSFWEAPWHSRNRSPNSLYLGPSRWPCCNINIFANDPAK